MKNACIAGVFLHPDCRKNRSLPPVARQPPIPPTGHAFSAGNKPPPIPIPRLRMLSCTNLPTINRKRQPSGKKAERGTAIRNTSRRQSRSQSPVLTAVCPPPDTVISPNRPFRQRTDIFCMDAREYGQEKHRGQTKRREKPGIRKYANRDRTIHHRLFRQCSGDRTFP